jgi:hypothetical protein
MHHEMGCGRPKEAVLVTIRDDVHNPISREYAGI